MLDQRLQEASHGVKDALSHLAPPALDEVNAATPPRTVRWSWKPALVAITAFAAVLVTIGAIGLIRVDEESVAQGELSTLDWSRVPHDEAVFGGEDGASIESVTAGGPGYVAVGVSGGGVGEYAGVRDAAVWTSVDGITWNRVEHNEAVFGGDGDQIMRSVTTGGPGVVAVGLAFDEPGFGGIEPVIWTSPDGSDWTRLPADADDLIHGGALVSVTEGGPGLVAVGFGSSGAAVWTSPDGVTWVPASVDPEFRDPQAEMLSVTVGGPGLVAVGSSGTYAGSESSDGSTWTHTEGSSRAVVWTSPDGFTWTPVPHDEEVFGGAAGQRCRMSDVTVGGPGLVAVGACEVFSVESAVLQAHGDRAVVWTSPDGLTWTRVPHDEEVFGPEPEVDPDQNMTSVIAVESGLIASGTAFWTSTDGITWARLSEYPEIGVSQIIAGGPGLIGVGAAEEEPDDHNAALVVAEIEN